MSSKMRAGSLCIIKRAASKHARCTRLLRHHMVSHAASTENLVTERVQFPNESDSIKFAPLINVSAAAARYAALLWPQRACCSDVWWRLPARCHTTPCLVNCICCYIMASV